MKSYAKHSNRLRRRAGVSQSGLRKIEEIIRQGERAVRRQFVAVERASMKGGHHEK